MSSLNPKGKAIIFSAPSGAGKSTLVNALLESKLPLAFSISATSRSPRGTEQDGKEYHFLSPASFKEKISNDELLEWEEVYQGQYYGTLKSELERIWDEGKAVLFDVDVYGGISLKNKLGADSLSIFIDPPSLEVLEQRLSNRGTEDEAKIALRMGKAKEELQQKERFDLVILNDDLDMAIEETKSHVTSFLAKS